MREPSSIVSTCFRPLSIVARAARQASRSVQSIRGPETWNWVERNPWASNLLEAVRKSFDLKPGHFQEDRRPNVCIVEYQRWDQCGGNFGHGCGLDLRRRNRRAERPDDHLDAWLARPLLAVPRFERATALDHRDDADRKGTVQCGAAAAVHRDCEHYMDSTGRTAVTLQSDAASRRRS